MRFAQLVRSNVDRQLSPNDPGRETGAIAVIVGIFLGSCVLLGVGALVIDTGSLLYERRQLQSGSDAVALSIAESCAKAPTSAECTAPFTSLTPPSSLVDLAGANAADQYANIKDGAICGSPALVKAYSSLSTPWTRCPYWSANPPSWAADPSPPPDDPGLVECPKTSSKAKYVEVRTSTKTGPGSTDTILPPVLSQMLVGAGTQYSNTTVKACARVGWGNGKTTGPVLPIAMSYCAWKAATGADPRATPPISPTYVGAPDYSFGVPYGYDASTSTPTPSWPTATENEIYTAASNSTATGCTTWNGNAAPGNFSALTQSPSNSCSTTASYWMAGDTGNDSPCTDAQLAAFRGKLVLIPLFDCVASSTATVTLTTNCMDGGNAFYRITGYATFYLTGWQFSGTSDPYDKSIYDNHQLCHGAGTSGNSGRCLSGWFTRDMIGAGEIDDTGAPDFGTSIIQVLG